MQAYGRTVSALVGLLLLATAVSCSGEDRRAVRPPRGYVAVVEIDSGTRRMGFGPFVGYYFRPAQGMDSRNLEFVCYNERQWYTRDLPEHALLFQGRAVFVELPPASLELPESGDRIRPLRFGQVPGEWLETRPEPRDAFRHFHSAYDALGPAMAGYWLRHEGMNTFTYDMGGRVDRTSVLYHTVAPGPDAGFAELMEFDRGPGGR